MVSQTKSFAFNERVEGGGGGVRGGGVTFQIHLQRINRDENKANSWSVH